MIDKFQQRKKDVLSKKDKSHKGKWDKYISKLCEKINVLDNYYTTSSCSGRVVLMIDQEKKEGGLLINIYHDLISFEQLKKDLDLALMKNKKVKFKMESCALHVACQNLKDAQNLYDKAKLAGWKKSGIIASNNRFVVELTNTDKLEFPIIQDKKILVDDKFLEIVVAEANRKLKRGWERIEKLRELIITRE